MGRIIDQDTLALQTLQDYIIIANTAKDYKMSIEDFIDVIQQKMDFSIPTGVGVTINGQSYTTTQLDNARDIFCDIVRFDLKWDVVETTAGVYDWTTYDTLIDELKSRGLIPFAILDYNNTIAPYSATSAMHGIENATQQAGFVAFAVAAADRYKDTLMIFEIWNEPNLAAFWAPAPDVDAYCDLVKAVVPAMKAADPYCICVGPAVAFVANTHSFIQSCGDNGIFDILDACSVHPYKDAEPEAGDAEYIYWMCQTEIDDSAKPNMPIIASEMGYSVNWTNVDNETNRKNWLARKVLYNMKMKDIWPYSTVQNQIIYSLWNSEALPGDLTHNGFGLYDYEGNIYDSGTFLSWVLYNLQGYTYSTDVSNHLYCLSYGPFAESTSYTWRGVGSATWIKVEKESGTFDITSVKITGPADTEEAPKDFTIKDESDSVLATFTSESFTSGEEREFTCVANGISAIKIDITDNNGANNTRIAKIELMDGTTSLVGDKTEDDGSASGDESGWTSSAKDQTKNDYHLKFTDGQGGIKYWSWTTGDGHYATFDGNTEYIYETPLLTQLATPVTTTGNQSISGTKTFTGTVKIDAENDAVLEGQPIHLTIPVVLLNDTIVAGNSEAFYIAPFNMTVTGVRAALAVAQSSGDIVTIDVNVGGTSILSTEITIDNGEKTSDTAETEPVIDTSEDTISAGDEITIDVDQIGDGTAKGLYVQLTGYITPST